MSHDSAKGARYGEIITAKGDDTAGYRNLVWKDLVAHPIAPVGGGGGLNLAAFRGGVCKTFTMGAGDDADFWFHIPHDYAVGTDMFLHVHWSHNGATSIVGNMDWQYAATYAKGHDQAAFPAEVTGNIIHATTDLATTPRWQHMISEIQLTAAAPSASQIDTDDLEVDGMILVNINANAIPTIVGGAPNEPFIFSCDIHYQADIEGTLNKAPNFYV